MLVNISHHRSCRSIIDYNEIDPVNIVQLFNRYILFEGIEQMHKITYLLLMHFPLEVVWYNHGLTGRQLDSDLNHLD